MWPVPPGPSRKEPPPAAQETGHVRLWNPSAPWAVVLLQRGSLLTLPAHSVLHKVGLLTGLAGLATTLVWLARPDCNSLLFPNKPPFAGKITVLFLKSTTTQPDKFTEKTKFYLQMPSRQMWAPASPSPVSTGPRYLHRDLLPRAVPGATHRAQRRPRSFLHSWTPFPMNAG